MPRPQFRGLPAVTGLVSILESLVLRAAFLGGLLAMSSGRLDETGKHVGQGCHCSGTLGLSRGCSLPGALARRWSYVR